jgi:hypothetical protein
MVATAGGTAVGSGARLRAGLPESPTVEKPFLVAGLSTITVSRAAIATAAITTTATTIATTAAAPAATDVPVHVPVHISHPSAAAAAVFE